MKIDAHQRGFKPQERFRLSFQQRLTTYMAWDGSAAEGFGVIWEKTLEEVPLSDDAQGQLYRELINWVRSDELFTGRGNSELLGRWRKAVHEF